MDQQQLLAAARPLLQAFPGDIWLAYELVQKSNGKFDKPPVEGFRTNDTSTWVDLPAAVAIAEQYEPGAAGVGFGITTDMVTFDFDDCIAQDGKVKPEVLTLIEQLDSFTYTTVSGRGIRVVCLNDTQDRISPGKYTCRTTGGHKVELFVGPCSFFNTFSLDTDGKPVRLVARVVVDTLLNGKASRSHNNGNLGEFGRTSSLGKKARNVDALLTALSMIPHDEAVDRDQWVKIGLAIYSGTGGSERGRESFLDWSVTWHRHDEDPSGHLAAAEALWASFANSPPTSIGAGTVYDLARQHGWTRPKAKTGAGRGQLFDDIQVQPMQDFVEDLLEDGSLVMVFGVPGSGKTFLVLDLLLHIAWGLIWFGKEVDQGPTLLFALEGTRGVQRRVAAFRRHHRVAGLPFKLYTSRIDLTDPDSVDRLVAEIKAQTEVFGSPVRAVAIDTLASALIGFGDENSAEVMNPVLAECKRIKKATGACVILIHHPGKGPNRGPRGFSGINAALDTLIEVRYVEKGKPRQVVVQKQRDLDLCDDLYFRLKVVMLGTDSRRGKPITSCVVVPILGKQERALAEAQTKVTQLTRQQRMGLDALQEALETHGIGKSDSQPARRMVSQVNWILAFRDRLPDGITKEAARKAVRRMRQVLMESDLIGADDQFVWLKSDEP